jgi:ATPase subunit of ABC transporter with duplicated ATPase domains
MSDWKARGQKRASSSQSTVVAGKRKRSRTMMSSEEEEEEWSEGDEELMMSQIQTQDMDEVGEEKPVFTGQKVAEAGVIDRIQLNDFMCHRKLDVALSPNTNFILGRNGSGKSAIMTAIVVALGGKATTTHRASSLKNFIRTGAKYVRTYKLTSCFPVYVSVSHVSTYIDLQRLYSLCATAGWTAISRTSTETL